MVKVCMAGYFFASASSITGVLHILKLRMAPPGVGRLMVASLPAFVIPAKNMAILWSFKLITPYLVGVSVIVFFGGTCPSSTGCQKFCAMANWDNNSITAKALILFMKI